ncbi:hypothetical protein L2E82_43197 [Cichorium intybus]|uniref:Uncharacterized protein n=1 Tax=Cichorium intybus TaxID=13427 RepID=A0ACB8ZP69_CICIN|nr:hypothetical protein L2E82_43197 [Cichorium intybus]
MASAPTCSALSTSEKTKTKSDDVQNSKPVGRVTTILNNLSKSRLLTLGNSNITKIITRGMRPSVPVVQTVTPLGHAESTTLTGAMMPTIVVNDNVASNVGPAQQTSNALHSKLNLFLKKMPSGIALNQCGYNDIKACESLAKDWPSTMQIDGFIRHDDMENLKYPRKKCAVIKLPSELLLLSVSDKVSQLFGMVIPRLELFATLVVIQIARHSFRSGRRWNHQVVDGGLQCAPGLCDTCYDFSKKKSVQHNKYLVGKTDHVLHQYVVDEERFDASVHGNWKP